MDWSQLVAGSEGMEEGYWCIIATGGVIIPYFVFYSLNGGNMKSR